MAACMFCGKFKINKIYTCFIISSCKIFINIVISFQCLIVCPHVYRSQCNICQDFLFLYKQIICSTEGTIEINHYHTHFLQISIHYGIPKMILLFWYSWTGKWEWMEWRHW
jgi:hypothetical protein